MSGGAGTTTLSETAYLGGIIGGEGCIGLGSRLKMYVTPTLQIAPVLH